MVFSLLILVFTRYEPILWQVAQFSFTVNAALPL